MDVDRQPTVAALLAPLRLRVEVSNGRIDRVAIDERRPVHAARVLEGSPAETALARLPFLYRLCANAQSVAGLRAVEAISGCGPGPAGRAARSLRVAFEALEQTLWRILLDWPRCVGARVDATALKRFRSRLADLQTRLFTDPDWIRLGGAQVNGGSDALASAAGSLARDVEALLFGALRSNDLLEGHVAFDALIRSAKSPVAEVFAWIAANRLEGFGGAGIRPANGFDAEHLAGRIARDDGWEFCSLPDQHGEVRQTGALARLANAPLVQELHGRHGYGLATQVAARLLEVPSLLNGISDEIRALEGEEPRTTDAKGSGGALGSVETARGRLFHWVEMRAGRITRYRTLAPTEWNFHPRGPLAEGLVGEPVRNVALTRRAVELFVAAIDPCVGTTIEIAEA